MHSRVHPQQHGGSLRRPVSEISLAREDGLQGSIHTKSEDRLSHSVAMAVRLLLLRQGQGCPGESLREPVGRLEIFSILIGGRSYTRKFTELQTQDLGAVW